MKIAEKYWNVLRILSVTVRKWGDIRPISPAGGPYRVAQRTFGSPVETSMTV